MITNDSNYIMKGSFKLGMYFQTFDQWIEIINAAKLQVGIGSKQQR